MNSVVWKWGAKDFLSNYVLLKMILKLVCNSQLSTASLGCISDLCGDTRESQYPIQRVKKNSRAYNWKLKIWVYESVFMSFFCCLEIVAKESQYILRISMVTSFFYRKDFKRRNKIQTGRGAEVPALKNL